MKKTISLTAVFFLIFGSLSPAYACFQQDPELSDNMLSTSLQKLNISIVEGEHGGKLYLKDNETSERYNLCTEVYGNIYPMKGKAKKTENQFDGNCFQQDTLYSDEEEAVARLKVKGDSLYLWALKADGSTDASSYIKISPKTEERTPECYDPDARYNCARIKIVHGFKVEKYENGTVREMASYFPNMEQQDYYQAKGKDCSNIDIFSHVSDKVWPEAAKSAEDVIEDYRRSSGIMNSKGASN